jgi:hypothetical protein
LRLGRPNRGAKRRHITDRNRRSSLAYGRNVAAANKANAECDSVTAAQTRRHRKAVCLSRRFPFIQLVEKE